MEIRQRLARFVTGGSLFVAVIFVMLFTLSSCFPPYEPIAEAKVPLVIQFSSVVINGRAISFAQSGDPKKPMVLFVHGTPGSKQGYLDYLNVAGLYDNAHLVAVDRPGFGDSVDGDWLPGLKAQAGFLAAMQKVNQSGQPMVVVGHSLGGTIAYRMALDSADAIKAIVVISSSIDPVVGQARWYNHIGNNFLIRWMLPDSLAKANVEIMPLKSELTEMTPMLAGMKPHVTVVHGDQDALVGFDNLRFAEKHVPEDRLRLVPVINEGHFILWKRPDLIIPEIQRALAM